MYLGTDHPEIILYLRLFAIPNGENLLGCLLLKSSLATGNGEPSDKRTGAQYRDCSKQCSADDHFCFDLHGYLKAIFLVP